MEVEGIDISQAKGVLANLYGLGQTAVLLGAPGVGKTEMVEELGKLLAEKKKKKFVLYDEAVADEILHSPQDYFVVVVFAASHVEPTDLIGIPKQENGHVAFKPLKWAEVLRRTGGILFVDEITNVSRLDQQTALLRLFCERTVGYVRLKEDVLVIGAGNEPDQSVLAQELSEPMRAGRSLIVHIRLPKLEQWVEYMNGKYGDEWDKRTALFLKKYPDFFFRRSEENEVNSVILCPRAWSRLAVALRKVEDEESVEVVVKGYVGTASSLFMSFLDVEITEIDELEKHPEKYDELKMEAKYFVALELSNKKLVDYKNLVRYIAEVDREILMLTIMLMDNEKRQKTIMEVRMKLSDVFDVLLRTAKSVMKLGDV